MSGDQRAPKHLLRPRTPQAPPKHAGRIINVQAESTVNDVINRALLIIKQQVDTLAAKSAMGGSLMDQDVKNLRTYVQSLTELSREERERTKHDGIEEYIAKMGPEELIKAAFGQLGASAAVDNAIDTTSVSVPQSDIAVSNEAPPERDEDKK